MSLTPHQIRILDSSERVTSSVSIIGTLFIICTFFFSPSFNKPINRLIFFASWGNLGASVSCLISELGPGSSTTGPVSGLCQFQGFLVQMFRGVDCYWSFCMAINVYLVFFRGYTTDQLRRLDVWYLLACYGLSFVPALIFLFISTKELGHVYGPAVIWCWITEEWDWMRVSILFASIVYFMAGRVIWAKREHLNGFLNPLNESPFANTVITEIEITYESRTNLQSDVLPPSSPSPSHPNPYTIAIHASPPPPASPLPAHPLRMRSLSRTLAAAEPNAEAWLYARVAILFFFAMILTWVPASVNRIWQVAHPGAGVNFPLNYAASLGFSLQGVWNTVVWVVTSKSACWGLWGRGRGRFEGRGRVLELGMGMGKSGQRLDSISSK
ncbi:camp receptor protein [Rutstroemia sp. NJR-2017a WRK4]|nr:camp receptor protein [Rutstroemia sp. NJR-2017a WRK4]